VSLCRRARMKVASDRDRDAVGAQPCAQHLGGEVGMAVAVVGVIPPAGIAAGSGRRSQGRSGPPPTGRPRLGVVLDAAGVRAGLSRRENPCYSERTG
jgi:hypothetical protein